MPKIRVASLIVLFASASSTFAVPNEPAADATNTPEEWPYVLPFLGKEAVARGYEIPLPVGFGLSHMYADRGIDVTSIRVGLGGGPPLAVNDLVSADVNTKVNTTVGRLDAWLFPFMNIYGFVGHVDNHSEVKLSLVDGGATPRVIDTDWRLSGPTYGGGAVLAGGLGDYFMTFDVNLFKADLSGDLSEEFSGSTYTARAGWNGKIKDKNTRFWLGASYWNTASTVRGSTPILGGLSSIDIEVEQEPKNPANINFGGYVEITRKIHFVLDLGTNFDDARTVLGEINYRFF